MKINKCDTCNKKDILGKLYYEPTSKKWLCENCFRKAIGLKSYNGVIK